MSSPGGRIARFRATLSPHDRRSLAGMGAFIVLLHVVGLGTLFLLVVPANLHLGGDHPVFNVGVGVLAYTFGMRHAFDADHIAAVDNTTRKLLADGADRAPAGHNMVAGLGGEVVAVVVLMELGYLDGRATLHAAGLTDVRALLTASAPADEQDVA